MFSIGKWAMFKTATKLWRGLRGNKRRSSAFRSRDPLLVGIAVLVLVLAVVWFVLGRSRVQIAKAQAAAQVQIEEMRATSRTNIVQITEDALKKVSIAKRHMTKWKLAYQNQEKKLKKLQWMNSRLRVHARRHVIKRADGSEEITEEYGVVSDETERSRTSEDSRVVAPGDLPEGLLDGPELMKPNKRPARSGVWVGGGFLSGGFGEVSVQHGRAQVGGVVHQDGDVGVRAALRVF